MTKQYLEKAIEAGYRPTPIVKDTKRAAVKGWNDSDFIPDLSNYNANQRWGARCGDNGLIVIDLDAYNADDPEQFLNAVLTAIEDAGFPLENAIQQRTLSDGVHFLFRTDSELRNEKLAFNASGDTTIETRGKGGYVVVYCDDVWEELLDLPVTSTEDQLKLYDDALSTRRRRSLVRAHPTPRSCCNTWRGKAGQSLGRTMSSTSWSAQG